MHIIYAGNVCADKIYRQIFDNARCKPACQSQKYHRLLIEGFAAHTKVDVVGAPAVNRQILDRAFVKVPKMTENGACYHHLPAIRNPYIKLPAVFAATFFRTLFLIRKDSAVVTDILSKSSSLGALLAAKLRRVPCVAVITDLPDMFRSSRLEKVFANTVIDHCTHYVVLTEAMNEYINPHGKPHVVAEGHADITMGEKIPAMEKKTSPRVCLYAGAVARQYGLHLLVEGFLKAELEDAQLAIYGSGDYAEELQQIASRDGRVFFGGMLQNHEVLEKEMEATLLVNPRPTNEEYVKYSFPSKTMEYMASGTPVMTTVLPGMPKEYYPHVFLLEQETADGIAQKLRQVLALPADALFEKGMAAREFILEQKSNVVQAGKILQMLTERK